MSKDRVPEQLRDVWKELSQILTRLHKLELEIKKLNAYDFQTTNEPILKKEGFREMFWAKINRGKR